MYISYFVILWFQETVINGNEYRTTTQHFFPPNFDPLFYPQESPEVTSSNRDHQRQARRRNASTLPRGFTPGYSRHIEELETVQRLLRSSTEHLLEEYQNKLREAGGLLRGEQPGEAAGPRQSRHRHSFSHTAQRQQQQRRRQQSGPASRLKCVEIPDFELVQTRDDDQARLLKTRRSQQSFSVNHRPRVERQNSRGLIIPSFVFEDVDKPAQGCECQ
jgi:hypothetical protein